MKARLQDKRFWLVGGVLTALTMVLLGWFAVINPQRSATRSLTGQTAAVEQQNMLLQAKTNRLKQQNTKLAELTVSLRKAIEALPVDSGLPAFTRQIAAQAKTDRVDLTSIAVGAVSPVVTASAQTPPPATSGPSNATTSALAIPITLVTSGLGRNVQEFVEDVQIDGPRRALVTSVQTMPASASANASINGRSTMTVQLTVFSAPMSPADQARLEKLLRGDVSN